MEVHQQHHGYLRGHQLLASSIKLDRTDQGLIDRLSDIAGSIQSGSEIPSYLTGYPLPSGRFFVFARTWYDDDAHRAGCVLTHSLLIPLELWSTAETPSGFRRLHRRFPHGDVASLAPIAWEPNSIDLLPPIFRDDSSELVEALFLEKPAPILWIAQDVENALLRIIDALWPSLRCRFAFQSFALRPRFLGERPFDLMAAPRASRGRFADWPGRRVEGAGQPRHSWTSRLAKEIFHESKPSLSRVDPLGLLSSELTGNQSNLRMSLLWNDFSERAVQSSTVALGKLDILAASPIPEAKLLSLLEPVVTRALRDRSWTQFPSGAGKFMNLLLSKLDTLPASSRLESPLRSAAREILLDNPSAAFEILDADAPSQGRYAPLVEDTFLEAAGVSSSPEFAKLWLNLDEGRFADFLERQSRFVDIALQNPTLAEQLVTRLSTSFSNLSRSTQERLRFTLSDRLDETTSSLIEPLVRDLDPMQFGEFAKHLIERPDQDRPVLLAKLMRAADSEKRQSALRDAVAASSWNVTDKGLIIADLLKPTRQDLAWLISQSSDLIVATFRASKWKMEKLATVVGSEFDLGERLTRYLLDQNRVEEAGKFLSNLKLPLQRKAVLLGEIIARSEGVEAHNLLEDLIRSAFPVGTSEDGALLGGLLGQNGALVVLADIRPAELSNLLFPDPGADAATVNATLNFLVSQPPEVRKVFAKAIDKIVDRLTAHQTSKLDRKVFSKWAKFLDQTARHHDKKALTAAGNTLDFALSHGRLPASDIAKSSFLIVYSAIKSDRRPIQTGFFMPRTDRPTNLRHAVADAYFYSDWPPHDLAVVAERLGISEEIFSYLERKWSGRRYLRKMLDDLNPKRSDEEKQARKRLRAFT